MNPFRLSSFLVLVGSFALLALQSTGFAAPAPIRVHERLDAAWKFERLDPSVRTTLTGGIPVTSWRWMADDSGPTDAAKMADPALDTTGPDWKDAKTGDDVFHGRIGFAWFQTTLDPIIPGKTARKIRFEGVDDNATVYLNGVQIVHHEGWNDAFDVSLAAWRPGGPNVLAVLVENTGAGGGITGDASLTVNRLGDSAAQQDAAVVPSEAKPAFDDHAWHTVHLPHDYVVEGTFDPNGDTGHGALPTGNAWYRKQFSIPVTAKGKTLWLDFEGVYRDCTVWLNGTPLGNHPCGYTGFQLDITKAAHYGGENLLAVYVNARTSEGWWYEGGGIYRHVWLNMASPVHIAQYGTFVTSNVSGLGVGQTPSAEIAIKTTVTNDSTATKKCWLESIVTRPGKPNDQTVLFVASPETIAAGTSIEVTQTVHDPSALLWSLETPQLYHLTSSVRLSKKIVDTYDTPFGVRTIRFDGDKGFFLNEKRVEIQGTCNHQDFAGLGVALPDGILAWRVKKLKEMGSNAYRTSHNEVAPALLDACDRQGMLVMDETRHLGDGEAGKASPTTKADTLANLRQQILQDRNHPAIVMWSVGNEEPVQWTKEGARISGSMKQVVNALDGTRPVTQAMDGGHGVGSSTVLDLEGFNYRPLEYDAYRATHPGHPMYGSETASALSTRGIYLTDKVRGYLDAYDDNNPNWGETAEDAWRPIAERPYMAGGFVWTGFDYKGEPTPYKWPCINSAFGIMDMCGFPKDTYYYYQSVWGTKPIVHILPHWNWAGQEGKPIDVWAYSNGDSVELFLNGTSLGSQTMPKNGHVHWSVPYQPGKLEAKASQNGAVIASDVVETTGTPAALRLTTDRGSILADGEDASPIKVSVVDAQGRVVPTADNLVTFRVSGPGSVVGVGNGNPSSHEPDKASMRHAFNGLCLVIVGASDAPGSARVTATADGLASASLTIKTTAP